MKSPTKTLPADKLISVTEPQLTANLVEASTLIRVNQGRQLFSVSGKGLTVAVLDTGLRTTHEDFSGRVTTQKNFTSDNGRDPNNVSDPNSHGTNVTGIIGANDPDKRYKGIAPEVNIIPLKVLPNSGSGSFKSVENALQWVIDNQSKYTITAVCMSLGDGGNYTDDTEFQFSGMRKKIATLTAMNVAVVVAAGNDFHKHNSQQGMGYPAILRDAISVSAVYDAYEGGFSYLDGSSASESAPDRITPFSQRLHETVNARTQTDIFAPGAPITSTGSANDSAQSIQQGTSQATPCVTGVILLMQEYYLRVTGSLPAVGVLKECMRNGGIAITDGDDEKDNVINTNLDYVRVDVVGALHSVTRHLQTALIKGYSALKQCA